MLNIFNLIKPHIAFIEAALGSLLLGFLSSYFLYRIIKKYYRTNTITPAGIIISACQRAFYIILPLIYFSFFAALMHLTTTFYIIEVSIKILITIALSAAAIKLLDYIDIWLERKKKYQTSGLNVGSLITRAYLLKKILTTVIIFITISLILLNFPAVKEIGKGILISASLIGGMLAFAAQKVFSNFFSGLDFILNKPMSVGDMVSIGSEIGSIEKITLSQIHLRTWDMRLIIYPLSYFNENPFQNLSYDQFGLKGTVFLYVDYTVDIENIRQILTKILEKSSLWDKYTNSLQVVEVNENNMQLRAVVGAKNLGDLWNLRCEVREKLITHIRKTSPAALPKSHIQIIPSEIT